MANYKVEQNTGGLNDTWHPGGEWKLGTHPKQNLNMIDISSEDEGKTLSGTISYKDEYPINFRATHISENKYKAEVQI
ncbi:MAG: hypothetical protein HYZ42_04130 [Bacteroidetes bacterium]|nr:hypothetical protein [Bacteroidota bacterium]